MSYVISDYVPKVASFFVLLFLSIFPSHTLQGSVKPFLKSISDCPTPLQPVRMVARTGLAGITMVTIAGLLKLNTTGPVRVVLRPDV